MSPTQLVHPWWCEEENKKIKVRRFVALHKFSLTGKAKAVHANKTKQGIYSLFPVGRCILSQASPHGAASWEENTITLNIPSFLLLPGLYAEHNAIWQGISLCLGYHLDSFGVSCPGCVCSKLSVHPQPPHW